MILPNWPVNNQVGSLSTTRDGGVSVGPYQGLNLAYHVGDNDTLVTKNRKCLSAFLPKPAQWLEQVHGAEVVNVSNRAMTQAPIVADGLYTSTRFQPLAIMTADCLPILLSNRQGTEVCALHGGWKPLANNIIANAISLFESPPQDIIAWLGPAIGPTCFEVGKEVKEAFHRICDLQGNEFSALKQDKYVADIYKLATTLLSQQGITQVFGEVQCTVSNPQQFYSYRRDGQTGRMATLIWRK